MLLTRPLSTSTPPPLALCNPFIFWGLSPRLGEPQATTPWRHDKSGGALAMTAFAGSVHAGLARVFGRLTAALDSPSRACRTIAPQGLSVSPASPAVVKWGDEEESCPHARGAFLGSAGGVAMIMIYVSRTRDALERQDWHVLCWLLWRQWAYLASLGIADPCGDVMLFSSHFYTFSLFAFAFSHAA